MTIQTVCRAGLAAAIVLCRLIPHPPNAAPVFAVAMLAGSLKGGFWRAALLALIPMALTDALLGFHATMPVVHLNLLAAVWLGARVRGPRPALAASGLAAAHAVLFFVTTNLAVWMWSGMYPLTAEGLWACYAAALPFLRNALFSNAAAAGLFFAVRRHYLRVGALEPYHAPAY